MNKVKARREAGAVCPKCKHPEYEYLGRTFLDFGKHVFQCTSCGYSWHYGSKTSKYSELK